MGTEVAGRDGRAARVAGAGLAWLLYTLLLPAGATAQQSGADSAAAAGSDTAGTAIRAGERTATLEGTVVSAMTGGPLSNALVSLKGTQLGAYSDSTGHFVIEDAPAGLLPVDVRLLGFADQEVQVRLQARAITHVTLLLSQTVLKVEALHVEVKAAPTEAKELKGFYARMHRTAGYFITPQMVKKLAPEHPTDLLRVVPGVQVGPWQLGQGAPVYFTRSRFDCNPYLIVDGLRMRDMTMDDLNEADILAVEVYHGPSETPPAFRFEEGSCGTIVVWTRSGGAPADTTGG
ncbi:MAG: carboxypeptidase-like regulatory domain-containing protein [Candidatus Palauibacterales bacterium]|nr:carboxypeptidase-like regulatory domain-containing protein [Candidatus Palauibacterales bacterium]MDP2529071.1 carboxypeptidase-like regulatory domain-containing protein [Candidatus Palauibacterales bacterium]MDP2583890.1 carboxypeptidase-like regulatory domain-containing protein [Candidatus Palauibacterales bacterium]